jgi:hypothetical protein
MALNPDTQTPRYAIEQGTFKGLLTGATPTIGTLNSDTNGVIVCPAVTNGSRIVALYGSTTDTAVGGVNVFLYGFTLTGHPQGSSFVRPIGLVNIPLSSANTFAARVHVDMLSLTNLPGLSIDSGTRKPFILLGRGEALKATTLANLSSSAICVISGAKFDYLG